MLGSKRWIKRDITDDEIAKMSSMLGISTLMSKIFLSRGIKDASYVKKFLNPTLDELHDPFLLEDMDKAVERVISAVNSGEKIMVYGDYDVDGITSTSVLYNFLSRQGANIEYYIPDRLDEGYGLSINAIDKISERQASLIVTVDCGITAVEEAKYIKDKGMDVIITDHHECKESLPDAYALVSPCKPDSTYPFKELAGVGVVFKFINAICMRMGLGNEYLDYLDLVALGTIADVVPLTGENRVIVRFGIEKIVNTKNIGLQTLTENCSINGRPITSWTVSFVMAPRINAAGRIGDAGRAVHLFTTKDRNEALGIVLQLNEENKFRQDTESDILRQVVELIEADENYRKEKVIVVAGNGWHHGVIGIVASKITDRYYKPCILISCEDSMGKGSGRSIEGFDLFKALNFCQDLLERFGGHELAAGLSIKPENIQAFRGKINKYANEVLESDDLLPKVKIDVAVGRDEVNIASVKELDALAPFGAGNPAPVFEYDGLRIGDIRTVGEGKHIKLRLEDEGLQIDAIGFNMGSMADVICTSDTLDAACSLEINTWNSMEKVQLNLKDLKFSKEITMKDEYFYTLDKCFDFSDNDIGTDFLYNNIDMKPVSLDEVKRIAGTQNRVAVFVNTLESAMNFESVLKNIFADIKKAYKICYTNFDTADIGVIQIIINPQVDRIDFKYIDHAFFYGGWIDEVYLRRLLAKAGRTGVHFIRDGMERCFNAEDIVPDRKDLTAVYQYIKANSSGNLLHDDMFLLARRIANNYRINMNYYKIKRSIEIFEELELIKSERLSDSSVLLTIIEKGKQKTSLESSKLYRDLQALKLKLKEA